MNESVKNCLHCGTPMQTQRKTKKYCSENCKQAAFQNRAIQFVEIEYDQEEEEEFQNIETITDTDVQEGNEDETEHPVNVNSSSFNANLNVKRAVREPTNVNESRKYSQSSKPVDDVMDKVEEPLSLNRNKKKRASDEVDLSWDNRHNRIIPKYERPTKRIEPKEERYQFVKSKLVAEVEDYLEINVRSQFMFQSPKEYWYGSELEAVKWVSLRFRSIVEALLLLDSLKYAGGRNLIIVRDSYKKLVESRYFRMLPYNYPFKNQIKELAQNAQKTSRGLTGKEKRIFIDMPFERKVAYIAMRFQLAHLVPKVRLSTLEFND